MPNNSSANLIRNLVSVRALLDRAVEEARQKAEFRRTTGVVLLDAVVERLLYESTAHLGQTPKRDFASQLDSLVRAVGPEWDFSELSDIHRLHRARNAIQHEGLGVDRDDVEAFVELTRSFAGYVISKVFGMNIWTLSAGYAIASDHLAEPFFAAEQAFNSGDATGCVRALDRALTVIRENAAKFAGESASRNVRRLQVHHVSDVEGHLNERINAIEDLALLGSLGADASKVLWFQRLSRESQAATLAEAERALGYMFWWVIAFEASLLIGDYDRRRGWEQDQRKVRTTASHARILSASAMRSRWQRTEISVTLGDVPPPDQYDAWARVLSDLMSSDEVLRESQAYVDNTGAVKASVPTETDLSDFRSRLERTLLTVEEAVEQEVAAVTAQYAADQAAYERFDAEVSAHRHLLPGWVEDVHLILEHGGPFADASIGLWVNGRFGGNSMDFANMVRSDPRVDQFYTSTSWRLEPVIPVNVLADILDAYTPFVRAWAEEQAYREEEEREAERRFRRVFGDVAVSVE